MPISDVPFGLHTEDEAEYAQHVRAAGTMLAALDHVDSDSVEKVMLTQTCHRHVVAAARLLKTNF